MRSILVLLAIVGVLVGALLFLDETPGEQGRVSVNLLAGNRLEDVVKLRWQFDQLQPFEIVRDDKGDYRLTEPVSDLASGSVLRNIGQTYDSAMIGETPLPDTPENRAKTGLDPPRVVLDLEFEDGSKQHLELGSEGPLGNDVFVRRDGKIYRGGLALFSVLRVPLNELRDPVVFRTPVQIATDVVVDRQIEGEDREELHLARRNGEWRLVAPIEARADAGSAETFARMLLGLRIDVFPAGMLRLPEGPPAYTVTVRGGREEEIVDFWLDAQDNLRGRHRQRGIDFISENRSYYSIFEVSQEQLRARILVSVGNVHEEVLVLMVDRGEEEPRLVFRRQSENQPWKMVEPLASEVSPTPVNQLLTALNNLRALQFFEGGVENPAYGFAENPLRIGYQSRVHRQPLFIRFGGDTMFQEQPAVYAARTDAPNEVVSVPKGAVDEMRRPWTEYVPLGVLEIKQAVSRLMLERRDGENLSLARDEQGDWVTGEGQKHELAADIVERLRDLRGKRALLRRSADLGDPDWVIRVGRARDQPGRYLVELDVWERGDLPLLVRGPGNKDIVFEISRLDSDSLRRLWTPE
ncbi:MAG: DUF4340 domain-containing protein [Planctomycetota bacterium]|nr:DUF4340 domain-containing protein [Planctomycetota bacterium]